MSRKQGERGKAGNVVGSELLVFISVKKWIDSLEKQAVAKGKLFTEQSRNIRLGRLMEYTKDGEINPDFLLEEAKHNIDDTGTRLNEYFKMKLKNGIDWNSATTNIGFLRGFYTHNDIMFPKRIKLPKAQVSAVKKTDTKTEIYGYDEENDQTIFKNGLLQQFFDNLSFRDQVLGLCSLSSGLDFADILKLKIGFIKDAKGNISTAKRFFIHDNRLKDGVEYKTYFSVEATEYIRRYAQQERSNADDNELLFVKDESEKQKAIFGKDNGQIPTHALSETFRNAANKMGLIKNGESNPFRPKRFRGLFRTACGLANIDSGYIMAMMGHASDTSAKYLEKSNGLFLKEYIKVEPWITVYGVDKSQVQAVNEEVEDLKRGLQTTTEILTEKITSTDTELVNTKAELAETKAKLASMEKAVVMLKTLIVPPYEKELVSMKGALEVRKKELREGTTNYPKDTTEAVKQLEIEIPQIEHALKILKELNPDPNLSPKPLQQ